MGRDNVWMGDPPHPNIVPYDRLVVEELYMYDQQRIMCLMSLRISEGALD